MLRLLFCLWDIVLDSVCVCVCLKVLLVKRGAHITLAVHRFDDVELPYRMQSMGQPGVRLRYPSQIVCLYALPVSEFSTFLRRLLNLWVRKGPPLKYKRKGKKNGEELIDSSWRARDLRKGREHNTIWCVREFYDPCPFCSQFAHFFSFFFSAHFSFCMLSKSGCTTVMACFLSLSLLPGHISTIGWFKRYWNITVYGVGLVGSQRYSCCCCCFLGTHRWTWTFRVMSNWRFEWPKPSLARCRT